MNDERTLHRWVTAAAAAVAVAVALGPPVTWYAFSYERIAGGLESEAEVTSYLLTQIIGANPDLWEFENVRLGEYLSRRPRKGDAEIRRVLGAQGDVVAESADPLPRPWIRRSLPLLDAGRRVGAIEIARSLRPILVQAAVLALLLVFPALFTFRTLRTRPLAALRRAEGQLRRERDLAQKYLDVAGVAFVILDAAGRVARVNRAGAEILGRTADDVVGREWATAFVDPADQGRLASEATSALRGDVRRIEFSVLHASGERRVMDGYATPLADEVGTATGLLLSGVDITEQRRLEQELSTAMKLRAVGRLADGVAHDFDEIITAIRKRAAALRADLALGNPHRLEAEEILAAAEKASALTQSLLSFSRRQAAAADPIDLGELVLRSERRLRRLLPDAVALSVTPAAAPLPVLANPLQLEQLLAHLVANARDAIGGAGRIAFALSSVHLSGDDVRRAGLSTPGTYARLSVAADTKPADTTPAPLPLDPLAGSEEVCGGSGLEPALVAGIVEQHRGAIRTSVVPGKGGTCTVLLPLAYGAPGVDAAAGVTPVGADALAGAPGRSDPPA